MFKLLKYLKKYRVEAVAGPLLKLAEASMEIFVPYIMSQIIDRGINNNDTEFILHRGILLVFIAVLGWIFAISAQYFAARAAMGFGKELRSDLFDRIMSLEMAEVDKITIPSLITRLTNDVSRTQTGVNLMLRLMLRTPFIILGAIIMSGFIDIGMMWICIATVPVVAVITVLTIKYAMPYYEKIQKSVDKIGTFCRENIMGARSVRAFRMQKKETSDFKNQTEELYDEQKQADRISALMNPLTSLAINAGIIIILLLGGKLVNNGSMLSGKIIAMVNYLMLILVAVQRTANLVSAFNKASASAGRINELLEISNASKTADMGVEKTEKPDTDAENLLELKNVSFRYEKSELPTLSNIDFVLKKGQSLGIIGGTGSGKTTLIKLIQGIYPVTEGKLLIGGAEASKIKTSELQKLFSVVSQKAELFKGTVRENILFGNPDATDDEIDEALKHSQAYDFVYGKADKLDHRIEYGGKNVSGGQKQRLSIARALIKKAPILIMDDATSALDYVTEAGIRKYILGGELSNVTKIIVSQRISAVSACNLIVVLDDGVAVGIGTHEELIKNCDVYKEIYYSQSGAVTGEDGAI